MRLDIAARILAAVMGGYALAAAIVIGLPAVLPLPRAEAVAVAMMLSFAFCCGAILWAFAVRSAWRAWAGILLPTMLFAALALAS
ncbi:DUF3649 domain-containing protein [Dongia rigui]|uniref:DUF3649 domain-containing protein n=1 Tax=Dongia rigui TaxID=940149 RepID=A0ABU5E273_9PROT|nr:DUF3649 domain-containing protein [Dongia rigui]MDY0873707.1 DUF3649 domain-containing protein [Dongia rigui]